MPIDPDAVIEAVKVTAERSWWVFSNPLFWLLPIASIWLAKRADREHAAKERERIAERSRAR